MKCNLKKLIVYSTFTLCLLFSTSRAEASKLRVTVDGQVLNFKGQEPYISRTGRTMVPVRSLSQALGYKVVWTSYNEANKGRVDISNEDNLVSLEIGSKIANLNGIKTPIDIQEGKVVDTRIELVNNTTYVPLRFIVESLQSQLDFSQKDGENLVNIRPGPKGREGNFIKPEVQIIHQTVLDDPCFFVVRLKNFKEYKDTDAKFTSYLESHSQYDKYKYKNPHKIGETIVVDLREKYRDLKVKEEDKWFDLYRFEKTKDHLDLKTSKAQELPKIGEQMRLILELEMNSIKKTYSIDFEFRGGPSHNTLN